MVFNNQGNDKQDSSHIKSTNKNETLKQVPKDQTNQTAVSMSRINKSSPQKNVLYDEIGGMTFFEGNHDRTNIENISKNMRREDSEFDETVKQMSQFCRLTSEGYMVTIDQK